MDNDGEPHDEGYSDLDSQDYNSDDRYSDSSEVDPFHDFWDDVLREQRELVGEVDINDYPDYDDAAAEEQEEGEE
ncbi:hypothetical protein A2U01_0014995, partial [Trifolium medium]|nr:hypothetical protein [Trifolium medium]